jgi:hypothetical protein
VHLSTVFAVEYNPFYITCPPDWMIFNKEDAPMSKDVVCTMHPSPDFDGAIQMDCDSSALNGVSCSTASPVDIPLGTVKTNVTVNVIVSSTAIAGLNGNIVVRGTSSSTTSTASIPIKVVAGGGTQMAVYDSAFGAPRCYLKAYECSSGVLLNGRGEVKNGPETNQPNTIDNW